MIFRYFSEVSFDASIEKSEGITFQQEILKRKSYTIKSIPNMALDTNLSQYQHFFQRFL